MACSRIEAFLGSACNAQRYFCAVSVLDGKKFGLIDLKPSFFFSTQVTCEGAVALAEVIADSSRLIRLDLRENEIKSGGLMALSLSLKMNFSVTRLALPY